MKLSVGISVAGALMAVVLGTLLVFRGERPSPPSKSPRGAAASVRQEAERAPVATGGPAAVSTTPPPRGSSASQGDAVAPVASTGRDLPTSQEQAIFELHQVFETSPAADARAFTVGRELEGELRAALGKGDQLPSVECRRNMCKAVMDLSSLDADRAIVSKLMQGMDGVVARFGMRIGREALANGGTKTTLFIPLG